MVGHVKKRGYVEPRTKRKFIQGVSELGESTHQIISISNSSLFPPITFLTRLIPYKRSII